MAENNPANQNAANPTEGNQNNQQTNTDPAPSGEKKYSEEEMNGISKRNSEKAVKKLLKDLGIEDQEKAKEILKKAAEDEKAAQQSSTGNDSASEQLRSELAAERAEKERTLLEAVFLSERVDPAKIAKAVRLVDLEDCRDDEQKFDRSKAQEAVKALLKEWPELAPKADSGNIGFTIGSDGQTTNSVNTTNTKAPPKKSWNRFN